MFAIILFFYIFLCNDIFEIHLYPSVHPATNFYSEFQGVNEVCHQ